MAATAPSSIRVTVGGKFLRLGQRKFYIKGVTYGPFAPNERNETFLGTEPVRQDFAQLRTLGANTVRVYYVPPQWFLDLAHEFDLKVLVDVPWPKHLCFLDSPKLQRETRAAVRQAASTCARHPAILAFSLANEIPAEIVRWSGVRRVEAFIDELVDEAKAIDPDVLCTYTSFPPTEFLRPQTVDFISMNVYLHERPAFESYLARLQMIADTKPLVLAEFGMDSLRQGEEQQADFLSWQIESAFCNGVAGAVVFSFTDDWWRGGVPIDDWAFGLTKRDRQPKPAFGAVQKVYRQAPYFPVRRQPKVSVVVASYNGGRTLLACLESLFRLNYPDYEVILVDDGSTDDTAQIAKRFPALRCIHQANLGLSAARNAGIAAASGEIVAFTDSDCRADEDWLYYLVADWQQDDYVGMGGHNFLPPDDSLVASAVMVSPGGPAHVMLSDREAEHIPGCNMAFYKWALAEIGGFDPTFRKAGDDVDVCWRLQQRGHRIGFSPTGFVWHYRRSTVRAYLQQQSGYGEAEALLSRKHPEYFNSVGRSIWRGRIYAPSKFGVVVEPSIIYHGIFGSGFFQKLYASRPAYAVMLGTSLEYHALITLPLMVLAAAFPPLWPLAITSLILSLTVCAVAAAQAELPRKQSRFWSRPLIALLYFLQPLERGLARYRQRLRLRSIHHPSDKRLGSLTSPWKRDQLEHLYYWSKGNVDRYTFLNVVVAKLDQEQWQTKTDTGWADHDLEIFGPRWSRLRLTTVTEQLDRGRINLRCRLETHWSLSAKILFWMLLGTELLVISLLASIQPWIWMLLLTLPLANWILEHEQLLMQQSIAALLDEAASSLSLTKLHYNKTQDQFETGSEHTIAQ